MGSSLVVGSVREGCWLPAPHKGEITAKTAPTEWQAPELPTWWESVRPSWPPAQLSGQGLAALTTTCGHDRATCAGAHAGADAVHACATTVIRLVSTLRHGTSLLKTTRGGEALKRHDRAMAGWIPCHCARAVRCTPRCPRRWTCGCQSSGATCGMWATQSIRPKRHPIQGRLLP